MLLSARTLSVIKGFPAAASAADSPVTGRGTLYSWAMGSAAAYGVVAISPPRACWNWRSA